MSKQLYQVEVNRSGVIGWISYARFAGTICEAWSYSVEDYDAVRFDWKQAHIVAKASGGKVIQILPPLKLK